MKINKFKELWFEVKRSDFRDTRDRQVSKTIDDHSKTLHHICHNVHGFGSPHTIATINLLLTNFLEAGEEYLEIGTFCGRSLIAGLQNNTVRANVIDDFIARGDDIDLYAEYTSNLDTYNVSDRVQTFKQDYRYFNENLPTIGLFYFDGPHERWDSYDGLKMFERFLSDRAIILVDDFDMPGVHPDVADWVRDNEHSELIDLMGFSTGTAIIGYNRS